MGKLHAEISETNHRFSFIWKRKLFEWEHG